MAGKRTLVSLCLAVALVAAPALADPLERGEKVYGLCGQCHGAAGEGNPLVGAPAIAGLPTWYVESQVKHFRGGVRGRHPDDVGGMRMRPMAIHLRADEDVSAVAAYVASLPRANAPPSLSGGDPAKGEQSYALCVACHGPSGEGNEALQAPPISGSSDWYLLTQLEHYKSGVRGRDPTDSAGATMWPMAMTLADEQAMKDVIAFIQTLGSAQ
jgi:cytochrome c553